MTTFDEDKFEEKYVHYFEELEAAYSAAFEHLHGHVDSTVLRAIDHQVLSASEPIYEGDGRFRVDLPDDPYSRVDVHVSEAEFDELLETFVEQVEIELQRVFGFERK